MTSVRSSSTFVHRFRHWARQSPERVVYTFLRNGEEETTTWTCRDLQLRVDDAAARLMERGLEPGDRVLLLFPPGLDFAAAFLGCLAAGAVAVPTYPPRARRSDGGSPGDERLLHLARDAEPRAVLTVPDFLGTRPDLTGPGSPLADTLWIALPPEPTLKPRGTRESGGPDPDDLAFLQYTSGSTAAPKGVQVTHRNLLANQASIQRTFETSESSVVVSWLPTYHDMGLIGSLLHPLYVGGRLVLMSPAAFLQRPLRWLQAVSHYRATVSGGPDFAYRLCVERIPQEMRQGLDLSSWQVAFSGAEPVRAGTLDAFAEAFRECGFRRRSFLPCYGLAEATLLVSGADRTADPSVVRVDAEALGRGRVQPVEGRADATRRLVGCGRPPREQEVVLADPRSRRRLPPGKIGEVWIAGENVAQGYRNRPQTTREVFEARLAEAPEAGEYLRTGDLGFLWDGELYLAGRHKDLIILQGRNLHPEDVESTAEGAHPAVRTASVAAFSVEADGREVLVVAAELDRRSWRRTDRREVTDAIHRAVAEAHEAGAGDVVLLPPGELPKTSSGKVRRSESKRRYLEGAWSQGSGDGVLPDVAEPKPASGGEEGFAGELRRELARILGRSPDAVDLDRPPAALGLDSLGAAELAHWLEDRLGVEVPYPRLLAAEDLRTVVAEPGETAGPPLRVEGPTEGDHPPSPGQRALWLSARLVPETTAFHLGAAVRLRPRPGGDPPDPDALARAWRALVDRHPVLRARFPRVDGEIRLRIGPEGAGLDVVHASGLSDAELEQRLRDTLRQPFDLERGPLVRARLWIRKADDVRLLLVLHHLVADFPSLALIARDLDLFYRQARGEAGVEPPPLEARYTDWVRGQHEYLAGTAGDRLRELWLRRLGDGGPPPLELATDRPRPRRRSFRGRRAVLWLDGELSGRLRALAAKSGTTPFTALLALYSIWLRRRSGQDTVAVGTPVSGRDTARLQHVVGYFANLLVVTARPEPTLPGRALLARVADTVGEALEHRAYPFAWLAEHLRPDRDLSRHPLVQALFVLHRAGPEAPQDLPAVALGATDVRWELGGLLAEVLPSAPPDVQADVTLTAAEHGDRFGLALDVAADLFDATTAQRMVRQIRELARHWTTAPERPVGDLPLLSAAAGHQILHEWNDRRATTRARLFVERLRIQAERTPEAIALDAEDRFVSYGELVRRTEGLAESLIRHGVGPEVPVAVLLPRSPELVLAVLGILAAGGAFLPLDPEAPPRRQTRILHDADPRWILTTPELVRDLEGWSDRIVTRFGTRRESRGATRHAPGHPLHLAYVIYTSGSTGLPKGVGLTHGGLANFVDQMRDLGPAPGDRILQFSTPSFDAFVLELSLALPVGATLHLASAEDRTPGRPLAQLLARRGITWTLLPPSTLATLPETPLPALSHLLVGGEACPVDLARRWARGRILTNAYGPTEATVASTVHRFDGGTRLPLGRPHRNAVVYLLNPRLRPVPVGDPGEIFLGGPGVARGYLGRPGRTARSFVPDPHGGKAGGRLYATGDLARARPDGELEYLGRRDRQVKLRGYRIELGDVEAALAAAPGVRQAAVEVRPDDSRADRLIAYVAAEPGSDGADAATLRRHLRERLPEYMVPGVFVVLDTLPRMPSGKLDRRRLAEAVRSAESRETESTSARPSLAAGLERRIGRIWREVLDIERLGPEESFFDLGGHSLLIPELQQRLEAEVGREVPVALLFEHPTVRSLSRALAGHAETGASPAVLRGRARARRRLSRMAVREPMAVVGYAGRFPGADDVDELWRLLQEGREGIAHRSREELQAAGVPAEHLDDPRWVGAEGMLDGIDRFDAEYFGLSALEAETMDPQQRLFLEHAVQALEHAGQDPSRGLDAVGLFAAIGFSGYLLHHVYPRPELLQRAGEFSVLLGNDRDFVPSRASYLLGLTGPSAAVQTACSGSLVAVHLACQALAAGTCDAALAGGASIRLPPGRGYLHREGMIFSPDGHCRAFDEEARGTVPSSGVAVVVLRRLEDARADGDTIHAVLRGWAVNNDGSEKAGYTAPGVPGQAAVIAEALEMAGLEAADVGYVEAHGTGTRLGDPVELAALGQAFADAPREASCAVGSLKSNLGHLDTVSGVAGLLKAMLALKHGEIPPTLHVSRLNPRITLEGTPFAIARDRLPWPRRNGRPRRAGVSSFGIGGTNAHVVLEEAPESRAAGSDEAVRGPQLLVLSARDPEALERMARRLADHLEQAPEIDLADVAYTLQVGRRLHAWRRVLVAETREEAMEALRRPPAEGRSGRVPEELPDRAAEPLPEAPEEVPPGRRLLETIGHRWIEGAAVDWEALHPEARRRIPLPTYPFARRSYWVEPAPRETPSSVSAAASTPEPAAHPRPDLTTSYSPPRGALEEILTEQWEDVLGVTGIGRDDDFFELGGHSLLATQLLPRIQRSLGVEPSLEDVFEAPTVARLAARLAREGAEPDRTEAADADAPAGDEAAEVPAVSFGQERLWFLHRLDPESSAHNLPFAVHLSGRLRVRPFVQAAAEVARRHEALRTTFREVEGSPRPVATPQTPGVAPRVDLRSLASADRRRVGEELTVRAARRPFDLARGPVFRLHILHLANDEHRVLLVIHHIASDGWSMGIWTREAGKLYAGYGRGVPSPLPEPPIRYRDWARRQRRRLESGELEDDLAYWEQRLNGVPAALELPADRPRRGGPGAPGGWRRMRWRLAPEGVRGLARRRGATPFMVLLAAFQTVLSRWSGQRDVVIGTPVANRSELETERVIGFFVNTLALRGDLRGDPTFGELLDRVRRTTLSDFRHQELPFERVVDATAPARDLHRTPLFQVMLVLQNAPLEPMELEGLRWQPRTVGGGPAQYEWTWSLREENDGATLAAEVEYDAARWDATTVERFGRQVATLLRTLVGKDSAEDRRLSELPCLPQAERHQVLREWSSTPGKERGGLFVHRFEAAAARRLDAVALVGEDAQGPVHVTYGELEVRSRRLAARLARAGVAPEVRVGVALERSPEAILAFLAILRAGGVYVPLDPAYPRERLDFMAADAGLSVLLTEPGLWCASDAGGPRVLPPISWMDGTERDAGLPPGPDPRHAAYLLYTSGSTGRPKGVVVPHAGLAHLTDTFPVLFGVGPEDRILQFAPLSFDASVVEMIQALGHGAQLHLASRASLLPGFPLENLLGERGITRLILPPSSLAMLNDPGPPALDRVVVAGEACPRELARRWAASGTLIDAYGPTEATVCATLTVYPGEGPVLIGRPLPAERAWVVDSGLRPVAVGVPGELVLGGPGITRGYHHRPQRTAQSFVPDPLSGLPGSRLYRTGDRARWHASGELEFLGRLDAQVKLRGFRIEPGEVEAALAAHGAVREAAVVLREDLPGNPRLVAYPILDETLLGEPPAERRARLRDHLEDRLPTHMMPAAFDFLDELPRTPAGKIDRRALREGPPPEELAGATSSRLPRGPVETALAGIFRELLGMSRVDAGDDFFALGGHSLMATRLVSRVRRSLGVELPVRAVFEASTLGALASRIEELRRTEGLETADLRPTSGPAEDGDVPLSFAQERLWFLDRLDPAGSRYHIAGVVELRGGLEPEAFSAAVDEVTRRHETLRTTFVVRRGRPRQVVHETRRSDLPAVDLRRLPTGRARDTARRLAEIKNRRAFDLATQPPLRLTLLRLALDRHRVVVVFHHVASDGWSMGLWMREVASLYTAFREGRPSPLPELPIRYRDYARWQRRRFEAGEMEAELEHWREHLAEVPQVLDLPTDRPRPASDQGEPSRRAGVRRFVWPTAEIDHLRELAQARSATLFMGLAATFSILLARWSDQTELILGTPVAGRIRVETEDLIGFFVNTLALRMDVSGDPTFVEILDRTREELLRATAHQELPFERLVEALAPQRDVTRNPLVQVLLAFQNAPLESLELPDLEWKPRPVHGGAPKFDWTWNLEETTDGGLVVDVEYDAELWDPSTLHRFGRQVGALLRSLDPAGSARSLRLSELPYLPEAERHQVRWEWSSTPGRERDGLFAHRFESAAARRPDAVALVGEHPAGPLHVTYGELETRSRRLAARLAREGVGPEVRVGVALKRSTEAILAFLGTLRAGGVYVPLDPSYPRQRLEFMAADAGVARILTEPSLWPEGEAGSPPLLPPASWLDGTEPEVALPPQPDPDHAAYLLYTSGSTGRPKGVVVPHRSLGHLTDTFPELFGIQPEDRVLQFASLSFDVSVAEMAQALGHGAQLHVASREALLPGAPLESLLKERGITLLTLPPSSLAVLTAPRPPALTRVAVAGEACPRELARRWGASGTLINAYGPTEATVYATLAVYRAGPVRIGHPLPGESAWILDSELRPAPIGVPGELYLGEPGLTRGYHRRPAHTAGRFLPDPLSGLRGSRLYRTGDRACWHPSGEIEFLGRLDTQVKVRGFRIEPGEIETTLLAHPAVREAAVVVREDMPGNPQLVAYLVVDDPVRAGARSELRAGLREHVRERLPDYMTPAVFVLAEELPRTPAGKLDRRALREGAPPEEPVEAGSAPELSEAPTGDLAELEDTVAGLWREVLGRTRIGREESFFDLGGHSLLLAQLHARMQEVLQVDVRLLDLFRHPTIRAQARRLATARSRDASGHSPSAAPATAGLPKVSETRPSAPGTVSIAVVGMAGRFPGAGDVEELWRLLRDGRTGIRHFDPEELREEGIPREVLENPKYVPARGALEDLERFDADFFGMTAREAEVTDPQHRLFLECAWHALEHAGHDPQRFGGPVGVFAGCGMNHYQHRVWSRPELLRAIGSAQATLANGTDFLATRVSYKLNLRGPSMAVQSACSTSLVAVVQACQSLLQGQSDMALAGGVTVHPWNHSGYWYEEGGIASPDGRTRAFDAGAQGTVPGSGAGVVVLRRLADALADGDRIYGVIRGFGLNNDGADKVGYTAPSLDGQAAAIAQALEMARIDPATLSYVEAHGTATPLGDPIEAAALKAAFRRFTEENGFCGLGSVKTNLGHLDSAAGVAGLIKVLLALHREEIPPSLHFETPNPRLELDSSPFHVVAERTPWPTGGTPRRAGVSAFGIGGTNAHLVVEEAPPRPPSGPARSRQLLVLSARTAHALDAASKRLADHLEALPELRADAELADVAYTLQVGRRAFPYRRAVPCGDRNQAMEALRSGAGVSARFDPSESSPQVVFLLPGQGAQHPGMGRHLYASEPAYRKALDACAEGLTRHLDLDLRTLLDPPPEETESAAARLRRTHLAQPALFAVSYACARLWESWGVVPHAFVGHSLGEITAACLAEVVSLEDALEWVATRGRLMEACPSGVMVSVRASAASIADQLPDDLVVAVVNGPQAVVVSGPTGSIEAFERRLGEHTAHRRLATSHAFHSPAMAEAAQALREHLETVELTPPRRPFASNVTGGWVRPEEATDPAYWARHLLRPVRFHENLDAAWSLPRALLLEVGPRNLAPLARRHSHRQDRPVLTTLSAAGAETSDLSTTLDALGALWVHGVDVDWDAFRVGERRRVALPAYPFERQRHWIDAPCPEALPAPPTAGPRPDPETSVETGKDDLEVPASEPSSVDPDDPVERKLVELFKEALGVEEVSPGDDFFELGGTSLTAVHLASRVDRELGVELSPQAFLEEPTATELAARIRARQEASGRCSEPPEEPQTGSSPICLQPGEDGRPPLWLLHPAGGRIFGYRDLVHAMGPEWPVYGFEAQGFRPDEEPAERIEAMAESYLQQAREVHPGGPFHLVGSSLGGTIAYEMARRLRRRGEQVGLVALLDTPGPGQMPPPMDTEDELLARFLAEMTGEPVETYRGLEPEEALGRLLAAGLGRVPEAVMPESLEDARRHLRVVRRLIDAMYAYEPGPYPGRLLYLRAEERRSEDPPHPELPWLELARGGVEVHVVRGTHGTLHAGEHAHDVARRLRQALSCIEGSSV